MTPLKIFITGSSDGLGFLAAKKLIELGHRVFLHAKSESRKNELESKIKGYASILIGDLNQLNQIKQLAIDINQFGAMDVVIQNAAIYTGGDSSIWHVNVLAPYLLCTHMLKPKKIIFVNSDMHLGGNLQVDQLEIRNFRMNYSDSKLYLLVLAMAFAKKWPEININSLHPGWVPTKMGGPNAPDNLTKGFETQVWLATSAESNANQTGRYFHHKKESHYHKVSNDTLVQGQLIAICERFTNN